MCVAHYPSLTFSLTQQRSKAADQLACQAKCSLVISRNQWQRRHLLTLSALYSRTHSHLLVPICLTWLSCPHWEYLSCAMLYLALMSLHTLYTGCLSPPSSLVALTYPALQFLDSALEVFKPGNWIFVEESNTLTKTAHIFDCLPGVGVPIFPPQLLLLACDACYAIGYLIDHSGCESIWSYVKLYIQCR